MEELRAATVEIVLKTVEPDLVEDYRKHFTEEMYISEGGLIWSNHGATGIAIRFWNFNGRGHATVMGEANPATGTIDGGLTPEFIAEFSAENMV